MNNTEIVSIAPLVLERAVDHHRTELPDDSEVLERLWRYLETTRPMFAEISASVSEFYDIRAGELIGHEREYETTLARQILCYLAYRYTRLSLQQIAYRINRDHSTVHHAVRKIEKQIITKALLADDIDLLRLRISEKMLARRASQC